MIENLVSGKKYRILTDATNDVWDRISFWTKASDVHYDDGTTAEENKPTAILKRNTAYTVGTIAYETTAPSWVMLRCTTAGTTASTRPTTYATISSVGTVISDGTAKFTVYDVRPSATLSTSAYQIPTMNLVNNLNSELTINNTKFYFDYQNGKYGYNTSAGRGADTFHSFKGDMSVYLPTSLQADYWAGVDGGWGVATMSLVAPSDGSLTYTNVNITSGSSVEEPSVLNGIGAYLLINGNSAISAHPEYDATNYPINQSASFTEGQTLTFQIWLFVKTHPANQPQAHLNWTWRF